MDRVLRNDASQAQIHRAQVDRAKVTPSQQPDHTLRVAAVGAGYWGQNMIRAIAGSSDSTLVTICDLDETLARSTAERYGTSWTSALDDVLNDDAIDALYVATPPASHFAIARAALAHGKHVLVEKPITVDPADAERLIEMASINERVLMTGHTFLYSPPVLKIKELIDDGTVGDVFYIESQRVNLGKYQDSGVLWDLAPHDLSMVLFWLDDVPTAVTAHGRSFRSSGREDVVFVNLEFNSGTIVQLHLSWLAPAKLRRTTISGSNRMVIYDDTSGTEAVKVYNHGVDPSPPSTFGEFQLSYRQGDIWTPRLESAEPLRSEWAHFEKAIQGEHAPRSSGNQGFQVVKIIEAAEQSLVTGGRKQEIAWTKAPRGGVRQARSRFGAAPTPAPHAPTPKTTDSKR